MGRKKKSLNREIKTDSRYPSPTCAKFITRMMLNGKRTVSARNFHKAMDILTKKSGEEAMAAFHKALENVKPNFEVKSRRVGGATYQVPIEVRESRRDALAMRWLITAARTRAGRSMGERLGAELVDAFNGTGTAFKKKEDTHRMAEANKAFSHFRW